MPFYEWLGASPGDLVMVVISAVGIYLATVIYTRVAGLRSFSKMSSFDFAVTVAFGSIIASTVIFPSATLAQGLVGLGVLYAIQMALAALRRFSLVQGAMDNEPRLLMAGGEILWDHMRAAKVTEDDLRAKLRTANVIHPSQILAVVMESTGDIAVLHAPEDGPDLDMYLVEGVMGADRLEKRSDTDAEGRG